MSIVHVSPPAGNATDGYEPKATLTGISPCGRHVTLQNQRGQTREYTVEVFETRWPGVAVRMTRPTGEQYNVFAAENGQDHQCDCMGYSQWGHLGPCIHLQFVLHAWTMEWLPGMRGTTLAVEEHPVQSDPVPCDRCGAPVDDPFEARCDSCKIPRHG
jgi:hypothetical protein